MKKVIEPRLFKIKAWKWFIKEISMSQNVEVRPVNEQQKDKENLK